MTARVDTLEAQHIAETARATVVEQDLQSQISALLANTDAVALNSLAELVTDYRQNGQGVADSIASYQASNDAALAAALARINLLETFIVQLQGTTGGGD